MISVVQIRLFDFFCGKTSSLLRKTLIKTVALSIILFPSQMVFASSNEPQKAMVLPASCDEIGTDVFFHEVTQVIPDEESGGYDHLDLDYCEDWASAGRSDYHKTISFALLLMDRKRYPDAYKFLEESLQFITEDKHQLYVQKLTAYAAEKMFISDNSEYNFRVAVEANERLINAGDATGHAGLLKLFGRVGKDRSRAFAEMEKGLESNDIGTLVLAEKIFLKGRIGLDPEKYQKITDVDYKRAFEIRKKLEASSVYQNQFSLASYYRLGIGTEKNLEKALVFSNYFFPSLPIIQTLKDSQLVIQIQAVDKASVEALAWSIGPDHEKGDSMEIVMKLLEKYGDEEVDHRSRTGCLFKGSSCINGQAKNGDPFFQALAATAILENHVEELELGIIDSNASEDMVVSKEKLEEGFKYARNSASKGYVEGQFALGLYKFFGVMTKMDKVEGVRLAELASSGGYGFATEFLSNLYHGKFDSGGRWKNYAKAIKINFLDLAKRNIKKDMGLYFFTSQLRKEQISLNKSFLETRSATEFGDDGKVTFNSSRLRELADNGNKDALVLIFASLTDKNSKDFSLNEAEEFLSKMSQRHKDSELSFDISELYLNLANIYEGGIIIRPNYTKAFAVIENSLKSHETGEAYARLGYMYKIGQGVKTDFLKAKENFEKSLEFRGDNRFAGGNSFGLLNLGEIFLKGLGVPADPQKALRYYMDAGDSGNMNAFGILSEIYELGLGVERDPRKAFFWMQKIKAVTDSDRRQAKLLGRPNPDAIRDYKLAGLRGALELEPEILTPRGRQLALLIGAQNYDSLQDLKTPIADISALGKILKQKYGFEVEYLKNPVRADITKKFSEYQKNLKKTDNLLIYYAGHGIEEFGDGYWLPVDAASDDNTNWISNDYITRGLKTFKSTNIVLISDSCFSGTLSRGIKLESSKAKNTLDLFEKTKSRIVITSGNLTPVLDGGGGNHSIFARGLLQTLTGEVENFSSTTMFEKLQRLVTSDALSKDVEQTPTIAALTSAGHIGPDFVFYTGRN